MEDGKLSIRMNAQLDKKTEDELVARLRSSPAEPTVAYFVPVEETREAVDHPAHYGGADNPLEVINIIEHYQLDFHLGNVVKYVLRAGRKGGIVDLRKALWYLRREISTSGERAEEAPAQPAVNRRVLDAISLLEATRWDPKNPDPEREKRNCVAVAEALEVLRASCGAR